MNKLARTFATLFAALCVMAATTSASAQLCYYELSKAEIAQMSIDDLWATLEGCREYPYFEDVRAELVARTAGPMSFDRFDEMEDVRRAGFVIGDWTNKAHLLFVCTDRPSIDGDHPIKNVPSMYFRNEKEALLDVAFRLNYRVDENPPVDLLFFSADHRWGGDLAIMSLDSATAEIYSEKFGRPPQFNTFLESLGDEPYRDRYLEWERQEAVYEQHVIETILAEFAMGLSVLVRVWDYAGKQHDFWFSLLGFADHLKYLEPCYDPESLTNAVQER